MLPRFRITRKERESAEAIRRFTNLVDNSEKQIKEQNKIIRRVQHSLLVEDHN